MVKGGPASREVLLFRKPVCAEGGKGAGEVVDLNNGAVASEMDRLLRGWSLPLQACLDEKFEKKCGDMLCCLAYSEK